MLKRYSEAELLGKPLSEQQKHELLALMDQRDEDIDLSDVPEIREIPADAVRGKHNAGPDVVFPIPVYLEPDIRAFLMRRATSKGVPLDRLVNDLLKRDIEAFRSLVDDPAA